MKHRFLLPLLSVLALLSVAAVAVFGMGRIAEQKWQAPDSSPAPVVNDTAIEQVESELKAYPYQILTLSAAQILYKEVAQAGAQLTMRETGGDSITAAKAAALAGELAMTLYGSDLSEKTLDLLPVFWQPYGTSDTLALWLAAYTLPDAAQTAPDSSTYDTTQGCWLFCLNAADGALLYSRCTALEGEADETALDAIQIDDESMGTLYRNTLQLAEALELSPTSFWAGGNIHIERGLVLETYLALEDGRLCRMVFDEYFRTENLFELTIAPESFFDDAPPKIDRLPLPLQPSQTVANSLPSAITLATSSNHRLVSKGQSASFSTFDNELAYINGYHNFSGWDFFLYRFDPATGKRSLLCNDENCLHKKESIGCTARACNSGMAYIFADGGNIYALPHNEYIRCCSIEQVYPIARTIHSFAEEKTGNISNAVADENQIYTLYFTGTSAVPNDDPTFYELFCTDTATGETTLLSSFPFRHFWMIGKLDNYLLFCTTARRNVVIETDAGLQPHDVGQREILFAFDLSSKTLSCIYDGYPDDYYSVDIATGRLWRAQWTPAGLQVIGQDLFTGKTLPIASGFFLPDDTPSNSLTHMEVIGNYLILRQWSDYKELYHMFDTSTGRLTQLALTDSHSSPAIIAVFGDEALVQKVSGNEHKYFYLSLPALFEGRVERRWVTDDFVLG